MQSADLDLSALPKHVAIIMDGNGRWAKQRGKRRFFGHQAGAKALKQTVKNVFSLNIPYLSLYAFSVDNWKREEEEVSSLMKLIGTFYKREFKNFKKQQIRILHSGIYDKLPQKNIDILKTIEEETKDFKGKTLNLCLNYGGRTEIVEAVKKIIPLVQKGDLKLEDLSLDNFNNYLFHPEVPDVDLMIRTSGEQRISDFLLWQSAYSEFYFTDILWPDFGEEELYKAIYTYQNRERRFGGVLK